jgi:hypothetical protein
MNLENPFTVLRCLPSCGDKATHLFIFREDS